MIFIEKNKNKNNIRNYIWFYDNIDNIKIVIGMNNNKYFEYEYIEKKDIYAVANNRNFKKKYSINYINSDLIKKIIFNKNLLSN
jgi:hypothetical protein